MAYYDYLYGPPARREECPTCHLFVQLHSHVCPRLFGGAGRAAAEAADTLGVTRGPNTTNIIDGQPPTSRQLARVWFETLVELGVYA